MAPHRSEFWRVFRALFSPSTAAPMASAMGERYNLGGCETQDGGGGTRSRARARFIASHSAVTYQRSILPRLPSFAIEPSTRALPKTQPPSVPVPEAAATTLNQGNVITPWQLQCLCPFRASLPRAVSGGTDRDLANIFFLHIPQLRSF